LSDGSGWETYLNLYSAVVVVPVGGEFQTEVIGGGRKIFILAKRRWQNNYSPKPSPGS